MKSTAQLGGRADRFVLAHAVIFAQRDRGQSMGIHLLRRSGRQIAVGFLMADEPIDGAADIVVERSLIDMGLPGAEQRQHSHRRRRRERFQAADARATLVVTHLHIVLQAPASVARLMVGQPEHGQSDGAVGPMRRPDADETCALAAAEDKGIVAPIASPRALVVETRTRPDSSWAAEFALPDRPARQQIGRRVAIRIARRLRLGRHGIGSGGAANRGRHDQVDHGRLGIGRAGIEILERRVWRGDLCRGGESRDAVVGRRANDESPAQQQHRQRHDMNREAHRPPGQLAAHPIAKLFCRRIAVVVVVIVVAVVAMVVNGGLNRDGWLGRLAHKGLLRVDRAQHLPG